MKVEDIAVICHEANRVYCALHGDSSQPSWEDAPDWQKDSAINGVNFHLANPDASPAASHENWVVQKLNEGWVHGAVKDVEAKIHHCLVAFSELPVFEQRKDHLFKAIVGALAPLVSGDENKECYEKPATDGLANRTPEIPATTAGLAGNPVNTTPDQKAMPAGVAGKPAENEPGF